MRACVINYEHIGVSQKRACDVSFRSSAHTAPPLSARFQLIATAPTRRSGRELLSATAPPHCPAELFASTVPSSRLAHAALTTATAPPYTAELLVALKPAAEIDVASPIWTAPPASIAALLKSVQLIINSRAAAAAASAPPHRAMLLENLEEDTESTTLPSICKSCASNGEGDNEGLRWAELRELEVEEEGGRQGGR